MLKQQIHQQSIEALKAGDQFLLGTLRMLLSSIGAKEKEKRYKISKSKPELAEAELEKESQLSDEEVVEVVFSEVKKRKDAIVLYDQGKRPELSEREKKEIEILKKYLPVQLSEEEIKKLVKDAVAKTGAVDIKDMGKIMAELNSKIKGKADGATVSKIVKESLPK